MIYEGIDIWNSPSLEHHGVKGMKWGVRHDNRSLGQRYSDWGRRSSNKYYDKQIAKIEARRKKRTNEISTSPIKNTRYGKWVQKTSNKNYDRERAYIESRRQRRTQEFDNFDKMRAGVSNFGKKSVQFVKDHKKEIAIGAAAVAGVAVAAGAYKLHSVRVNNMIDVGRAINNNNILLGNHVTSASTATFKNGQKIRHITREVASIKKGVLGPTLDWQVRNTSLYRGGKINNAGKYIAGAGKMQRATTVNYSKYGRNGDFHLIPKDRRLRKDYIKIYKDAVRKR